MITSKRSHPSKQIVVEAPSPIDPVQPPSDLLKNIKARIKKGKGIMEL